MIGPFTTERHERGSVDVEERLFDIHRGLCLLHAASQAPEDLVFADEAADEESLKDAIAQLSGELARRVRDLIDQLPNQVKNMDVSPPGGEATNESAREADEAENRFTARPAGADVEGKLLRRLIAAQLGSRGR